jgi:homoserine kinase
MRTLTGREIAVPASIGNLGPGFDTFGLAVSLYLRVRVTAAIDDGKGRLVCHFLENAPRGSNRIERAFHAPPNRRRKFRSLEVEVRSEIPQGAGLGSSAAATVAGLRLRELVDGRRSLDELAAAAYGLEGHPDNAAAALFGGLTSSCASPSGVVTVARWRWPASWRILVATPDVPLATSASRRVLPDRLPQRDTVFNFQRIALLLAAVERRDARMFGEALEDRCHQPYRQSLVPLLHPALELQHPDLLGVCLSGAGPSVAVFARRNVQGVRRALERMCRAARVACTIRALKVHEGEQE